MCMEYLPQQPKTWNPFACVSTCSCCSAPTAAAFVQYLRSVLQKLGAYGHTPTGALTVGALAEWMCVYASCTASV